MNVARNVMIDGRLAPGGGAVEMALAQVSARLLSLIIIFNLLIMFNLSSPITLKSSKRCTKTNAYDT